ALSRQTDEEGPALVQLSGLAAHGGRAHAETRPRGGDDDLPRVGEAVADLGAQVSPGRIAPRQRPGAGSSAAFGKGSHRPRIHAGTHPASESALGEGGAAAAETRALAEAST